MMATYTTICCALPTKPATMLVLHPAVHFALGVTLLSFFPLNPSFFWENFRCRPFLEARRQRRQTPPRASRNGLPSGPRSRFVSGISKLTRRKRGARRPTLLRATRDASVLMSKMCRRTCFLWSKNLCHPAKMCTDLASHTQHTNLRRPAKMCAQSAYLFGSEPQSTDFLRVTDKVRLSRVYQVAARLFFRRTCVKSWYTFAPFSLAGALFGPKCRALTRRRSSLAKFCVIYDLFGQLFEGCR